MKEFRVELRVKNNLLVKRREELGLSVREAAEKIGIYANDLCSYEGLKRDPISNDPRKDDFWKPTARKIADFYGESPEAIWPDIVRKVIGRRVSKEIDGRDAMTLASFASPALLPDQGAEASEARAAIRAALSGLEERERQIIEKRFIVGRSLGSVAADEGVTRERIRQIEARALRKLRHPSLSRLLVGHTDGTHARQQKPIDPVPDPA